MDDTSQTVSLIWNKDDSVEVKAAAKRFDEYLEKGWIAFTVTLGGIGTQIHRFDPGLEKIVFIRVAEGG